MSHQPKDGNAEMEDELDRALRAARPVLPAGFADAILRRATAGAPVAIPEPRRRRLLVPAALLLCAAALALLFLMPPSRLPDTGFRVAAGAPIPADGHIAVAEGEVLRLERAGGQAIELSGGASGALLAGDVFHLQHGRARLEGAVEVSTPRARVVGVAADALAELNVDSSYPEETDPMLMKTMTALVAAAAGSVLTVAVIRGNVTVAEVGPAPAQAATLAAGDRAVIPDRPRLPVDIADEAAALMSKPSRAPAAAAPVEGADECPPVAAAGGCDGPPSGECEGACDGAPEPVEAQQGVIVNLEGAPAFGAANARVTVVEFTDYQCPFCEKALSTVHELAQLYPKDVRVVLKNFPLPGHKQAKLAAAAALAAGEQGKYWEMHDALMANQANLERDQLEGYAAALGLDVARWKRELDSGRPAARVDADAAEAREIGLEGVPSFVINGRLVVGARPLEDFKKIIDEELAR